MDDYIDYYYETAMEAERDYNDFIEEALELHRELKEMDNIVWKNYRELLLWSRNLRSSAGKELWRKYEKWNDEFRHDVYDLLKSKELDVDSLLKFDDFIKNFEDDSWDVLHGQLERYSLRIWEDVYCKIDDVQQVCNKLDVLGKSEQTFEDCRNRVFGL